MQQEILQAVLIPLKQQGQDLRIWCILQTGMDCQEIILHLMHVTIGLNYLMEIRILLIPDILQAHFVAIYQLILAI